MSLHWPCPRRARTGCERAQQDSPLFDHLVRRLQKRFRDGEPKRLRGLEIDHEPELGRQLDRQLPWLGAFQDEIDVAGRTEIRPPLLANERMA